MDQRDIVEQLQDACELQTDKRELERLCGNARAEILNLRAMYAAQCACADEWAAKYRAEVERKAGGTLLARIDARLTGAQANPEDAFNAEQAKISGMPYGTYGDGA